MITILSLLDEVILKPNHFAISNIEKDAECEEYLGFNFNINHLSVKFRKAKITPKKVGQFVTLWKRNEQKITEPFHENDQIDFVVIAVEDDAKLGLFIFPKSILIEKNILKKKKKEGKRGFRVYPDWVITENKQAEKTQNWQKDYFVEIENNQLINPHQFKEIMKQ